MLFIQSYLFMHALEIQIFQKFQFRIYLSVLGTGNLGLVVIFRFSYAGFALEKALVPLTWGWSILQLLVLINELMVQAFLGVVILADLAGGMVHCSVFTVVQGSFYVHK